MIYWEMPFAQWPVLLISVVVLRGAQFVATTIYGSRTLRSGSAILWADAFGGVGSKLASRDLPTVPKFKSDDDMLSLVLQAGPKIREV
ncbi:hypothetical protein [Jannaschia faecimaris]|uniref:hypothetical protein n=1 Tax=Jannaschia faecimaris TaxID=1244108 RepID=UPI0011145E7D|nr:hypothetical protein [Jannaschia faecimaris]